MDENEKYLRKTIGRKIKLARSKTNYTQEKLAEELQLSTRYISQLERGIAFGSATTIVNLCKALKINSDFLFHDLIECDSPQVTSLFDQKFMQDYIQLDDYNKCVIRSLANELVKLQTKEEKKKFS
jgi:transcriptional regulator with XRE-family HTH domain